MTAFRSARKEGGAGASSLAGGPAGNKARGSSVPPAMGTVVSAVPGPAARAAPSPLRRVAAAGSLAAVAAGIAWAGVQESTFVSLRVGFFAVAGMVALASAGLLRRSVVSQVLSRAVAWVVLLPMGLDVLQSLATGHAPQFESLFFGGAATAALLLARPALHTDAARAEFNPVAYRRWFLAGAVASATAGVVAAFAGAGGLLFAHAPAAVATLALAAALVASAVGVVRMRSWGVLLGVLTSLVSLGAAVLTNDVGAFVGLALAALPGLLLVAPIVASRVKPVALEPSPSPAERALTRPSPPVARLDRVPPLEEPAAAEVAEPPFRARIDAGACDIPAGHVAEPLEAKDPRSAAR